MNSWQAEEILQDRLSTPMIKCKITLALTMLYAKNLPSNAGVEILGDSLDFDRLYDSLHEIVGREGGGGGVSAGAGFSCRLKPDAQPVVQGLSLAGRLHLAVYRCAQPSVLHHVAGETAEKAASDGGFLCAACFGATI
jgi:hypothetical protein